MNKELNEDFLPIVKNNFINIKGNAKRKKVSYGFDIKKFKKRALTISLACLTLISIASINDNKLGREIANGLKIEKILNDTYNTDEQFKEQMDKLRYCYDAGYGVPILNGIYEPFMFGTPECDNEYCTVCAKNREIRKEIEQILCNNSEYLKAKSQYEGTEYILDINEGRSK